MGEELGREEVFGTIEAVKTVSDLFMPITGSVTEKNPAIDANPEIVNKDPYGDGWLVRVAIVNSSELDQLLDAAAYKSLIGQ